MTFINRLATGLFALAAVLALGAVQTSVAQPVVFARVSQTDLGVTQPFTFTNNGNGTGAITLTTNILFFPQANYQAAANSAQAGTFTGAPVPATITFTVPVQTNQTAFNEGTPTQINQPMNIPGTFTINSVAPIVFLGAPHTNLLTGTITGRLLGSPGAGGVANFAGDTRPSQGGYIVNYGSDFVSLAPDNNFLFSLDTVSNYDFGPGGLLGSFTAALSGRGTTFGSSFVSSPVPEPASVAFIGVVGAVVGWRGVRRQGLKKRLVPNADLARVCL